MELIAPKLREAEFFLELLDALEKGGKPLSNLEAPGEEASFLLSAITNAFYSALDQWRKAHPKKDKAYQRFVRDHPEIYGHSKIGGWRNKTVHELHVSTSFEGYKPPPGDQVALAMRPTPKILKEECDESLSLSFAPYFYFEFQGKQLHAVDWCYQHLHVLRTFILETNDY